jgi:molybdenum cofactor cytidylyltransferase
MLAAAILAAGESRRMGSPKALVPLRGQAFLEHLASVVRHPRIGAVRVILGAHAEEIHRQVPLDPDEVVVNTDWESGQLSSIHAALRSLPSETEGLLLCPVDHPLISAALVAELIAQFDASGKLIVLPTFRGRRGHPVIFSRRLYSELLAAPHDVGARAVVRAHPGDILEVLTDEEGVVLNLDDPDALQKALGTS